MGGRQTHAVRLLSSSFVAGGWSAWGAGGGGGGDGGCMWGLVGGNRGHS